MDLETLRLRAQCIAATRSFFSSRGYLETDTPALSPSLIPETCLEVFKTEYLVPFREDASMPLYLVPSPEVYIKRLIADHGVSMFQVSKCYRNVESVGKIHSPEFTMLEYYTMDANYTDSLSITEALVARVLNSAYPAQPDGRSGIPDHLAWLAPPYERLTMNEAFARHAGFALADCPDPADLARHAARFGLGAEADLAKWAWDDLYELILVHAVEPALTREKPVFLMDYPARVPCLAGERATERRRADGTAAEWLTKERWELYARGVELANCYTEERDAERIEAYMAAEGEAKDACARVPHPAQLGFGAVCARMPPCSGVAMGLDRLIMLIAGKTTIDSVLPFPLADSPIGLR